MKLVTKDTYYVGVNDHQLDLFEGQFIVENGMAYNSYIIKDEKVAIFDSVDIHFFDDWYNNIKEVLGEAQIDYIIVDHMEPDHSANLMRFLEKYPNATVVGNAKTFKMIEQFFGVREFNKLEVKENDILNLGNHKIKFIFAPMVHWPEVMMGLDLTTNTLFSADAFGKFGALDVEEDWACEARRYYFGIVGKYGNQVQNLFKKISSEKIDTICPLHGPILDSNLDYYLGLYNTWSSYESETDGVAIFYTSVYGHTKAAAEKLYEKLVNAGVKTCLNDLARTDMAEDVEDAFRYNRIVLATTTYNMSIFPQMNDFLTHLVEKNYQNKIIGLIENGTWAINAAKVMKEKLSSCKNLTFLEPTVSILSSMTNENETQLEQLFIELTK